MLLVAVFAAFHFAAAAETPSDVRVLPGSPFYFLKIAGERIGLFFTFNKAAKVQKLEDIAERRLAEAEALAEKDPDRVKDAVERYEARMNDAVSLAEENKDSEAVKNALTALTTNTLKHQEILAALEEKVPEQARDAIVNAQDKSAENIAGVIERMEGAEAAEEYRDEVERVQEEARTQQMERAERVEQESSPEEEPGEAEPRGLNPLLPGQGLRDLNPLQPPGEGENRGAEPAPQAAPVPIEAPGSQD